MPYAFFRWSIENSRLSGFLPHGWDCQLCAKDFMSLVGVLWQ